MKPLRSNSEARSSSPRWAALLASFFALVLTIYMAPISSAATTYDLVDSLEFTAADGGEDDPIYVGNTVSFRGTWDASRAGMPLVNGDQFTIDFQGSAAAVSEDLQLNEDRGGTTWTWGTCVPSDDRTSYLCTFDNIPAGEIAVGGDFLGRC